MTNSGLHTTLEQVFGKVGFKPKQTVILARMLQGVTKMKTGVRR